MALTGKTVFVRKRWTHGGLIGEWKLHDCQHDRHLDELLKSDPKDIRIIEEAMPEGENRFDGFVDRHFNGRLLSKNDYYKTVEVAEIPFAEELPAALKMLADGEDKVLVQARFDEILAEQCTDRHGDRAVLMNRFVARRISYRFCLLDSSPLTLRRYYRDRIRAIRGIKRKPRKRILTHHQTRELNMVLFDALPEQLHRHLELRSHAWTRDVFSSAGYALELYGLARRYGRIPVRLIRAELKGIDLDATRRAWSRVMRRHEWAADGCRKAFRLLDVLTRLSRRKPCPAKS